MKLNEAAAGYRVSGAAIALAVGTFLRFNKAQAIFIKGANLVKIGNGQNTGQALMK